MKMKKKSCEGDSDLYKGYFELGTSMKKLTILLSFLSCSAGSVAQDLWSLPGPDEKNGINSYKLVQNDSYLVHGLLEIEGALVGSSRTEKDCSQFDNDRVTLLLRPEPRNPLNMMQNGSRSIVDQRFLYDESEFEEGGGVLDPRKEEREGVLDRSKEDFFNQIVWAPRIGCPGDFLFDCIERHDDLGFPYWARSFGYEGILFDYDEWGKPRRKIPELEELEALLELPEIQDHPELQELLELRDLLEFERLQDQGLLELPELRELRELQKLRENDSEFLQSGTVQYQTRARSSKEQGFFRISQFIWDPTDPPLFPFKDEPFISVFLRKEFFADADKERSLHTSQRERPKSPTEHWFIRTRIRKELHLLIDRHRWFRTNSSLSDGSFRSNTLSESYQYLSNLFLSNGTLLDQMTKTLLRKRWLFPDEKKIGFM